MEQTRLLEIPRMFCGVFDMENVDKSLKYEEHGLFEALYFLDSTGLFRVVCIKICGRENETGSEFFLLPLDSFGVFSHTKCERIARRARALLAASSG